MQQWILVIGSSLTNAIFVGPFDSAALAMDCEKERLPYKPENSLVKKLVFPKVGEDLQVCRYP